MKLCGAGVGGSSKIVMLHSLKLPGDSGSIEGSSVNAMTCKCTSPLPSNPLHPCFAKRMLILKHNFNFMVAFMERLFLALYPS